MSLFDISGFTAAIREMDEISQRHSSHPVIHSVLLKIKGLSPAAQETLSRKIFRPAGLKLLCKSENALAANAQKDNGRGFPKNEAAMENEENTR
jgi:hypothetical protein